MLKILTIISYLFLSACMVGPDYKEPQKKVAEHWLKHAKQLKNRQFVMPIGGRFFHDPTLSFLIYKGYQNNLSLQSTAVRVLQARAQLAQSVGELYPQQQALMGNFTYNRIGGGSLQNLLPPSFETALLGISASWEIDFWGKYRRAILSNDATFLASFAAYDNALVTLTSDIATTYINIRTSEELIQVTKRNIQVQALGLKIANARFKAGQTSLLDVEQAQTELSQTQSTLPPLLSNLQHQKDLLAVLLGTTPNSLAVDALLAKKHGIPQAPQTVAVGIPKETLVKRPDIYQARLEAIAKSETIGAAQANLYPSFSLAGTFAFASNNIGTNSLGDIFNWGNRTITAGPSFNWPILNYGQITNAVRVQDAAFQQALLKYLNLVLQAQQEVQDNITRYIEAKKSERYLVTANNSATKSTRLALIRYREGESDYTTVLDVERQQLRVQTSLTNAKGDIPKALVALYRALGGGWQIRGCNDIVPKEIKAQMAARTNWGDLLNQQNHQPPANKMQQIKQRLSTQLVMRMNPDKRLKLIKTIAIVIAIFLLFIWVMKYFTKSKTQPPPPPAVIVQKPASTPITEYITQTGTLVAYNSVDLVARIEGYLEAVEFTDGTFVKKGQELFVVEPQPYLEKLKSAQASVAAQKAAYAYANAEYERQKNMYRQNATSLNNVEKWSAKAENPKPKSIRQWPMQPLRLSIIVIPTFSHPLMGELAAIWLIRGIWWAMARLPIWQRSIRLIPSTPILISMSWI